MANLRVSLTDTLCAHAKAERSEYALRDTRQPGLCFRVQPSGAKRWIVRIRTGGKPTKSVLGAFPEMGVKAARQAAAAILSGAPDLLPAAPPVPTFAALQKEHERRHASFYKPSGLQTYRTYVRLRILPAFGRKRLDAITRQDVVRWFELYSATSPGGANRALGILHQILGTAKDWGHLPPDWINPTDGVRRNRRRIVGTFLSEAHMERLGAVLQARVAEGCPVAPLLRFLTLTGCRVGEAIDLEWRDVLSDRLRLRDSKTGPRDVLIGVPVLRFLAGHRERGAVAASGNARVFPFSTVKEYGAVRSAWLAIRRQADLPSKLRLHDLRHSFASHAVMTGETLLTTSRLLGHSRIQTTFRYAHLGDGTMLRAAEDMGKLLMAEIDRGDGRRPERRFRSRARGPTAPGRRG